MTNEPNTEYLNVDLELTADFDLTPLADALSPELIALHVEFEDGIAFANLELELPDGAGDPDTAVQRITARVAELDGDVRAAWNACSKRVFNIGIQSGLKPYFEEYRLQQSTLEAVVALSAEIVFAVYGTQLEDDGNGSETQ